MTLLLPTATSDGSVDSVVPPASLASKFPGHHEPCELDVAAPWTVQLTLMVCYDDTEVRQKGTPEGHLVLRKAGSSQQKSLSQVSL